MCLRLMPLRHRPCLVTTVAVAVAAACASAPAIAQCEGYRFVDALPAAGCSDVTLSPDGARLFVRHGPSCCDGSWRTFSTRAPFPMLGECSVPGLPWTSDISPDGAELWTSVYFGGYVRALDVGSFSPSCSQIHQQDVGNWTDHVLVDDEGDYVYVGENDPGTNSVGSLKILDAFTSSVVCSIALNGEPGRIAQATGDPYVYVISRNANTERLYRIAKPPACGVVGSLNLYGARPGGFSVSADGATLYIAARNLDAILVVDTHLMTITNQIPISDPEGAFVAPCGDHLLAPNTGSGGVTSMTVIGLPCGNVQQSIALPALTGLSPGAVEFSADGHRAYWPAGNMGALVFERGCVGDINRDGFVNLTDLSLLLANFGSSCVGP